MSSPTSNKMMHPLLIEQEIRRKYIVGYVIQIWLSLVPAVLIGAVFWNLWAIIPTWVNVLLILPELLVMYYVAILNSLVLMKLILIVLNLLHEPQEGIYPRDLKNKDYKYYNLRNYASLFASYLIASTPFSWFRRKLYFQAFGIKIGKSAVNLDCWLTPGFIEIGDNVILGHAVVLMSSWVEADKLLIKKIKIDDNAIIGAKTVIYPGVTIGKGTMVAAGSFVVPFQSLEPDCEYFGYPVKFIRKRMDVDVFKKQTDLEK